VAGSVCQATGGVGGGQGGVHNAGVGGVGDGGDHAGGDGGDHAGGDGGVHAADGCNGGDHVGGDGGGALAARTRQWRRCARRDCAFGNVRPQWMHVVRSSFMRGPDSHGPAALPGSPRQAARQPRQRTRQDHRQPARQTRQPEPADPPAEDRQADRQSRQRSDLQRVVPDRSRPRSFFRLASCPGIRRRQGRGRAQVGLGALALGHAEV
jgi:hypothetical protein